MRGLVDPSNVSIHAPGKGATHVVNLASGILDVSIHAPGKGATVDGVAYKRHKKVSIHAPGKGATSLSRSAAVLIRCFNPRAREGRDSYFGVAGLDVIVSIHAPGKGATGRLHDKQQ